MQAATLAGARFLTLPDLCRARPSSESLSCRLLSDHPDCEHRMCGQYVIGCVNLEDGACAVIILVGNKTDLAELREVSAEEGQEYAAQCAPSTHRRVGFSHVRDFALAWLACRAA